MYEVIEIPQDNLQEQLNNLEIQGYALIQLIPITKQVKPDYPNYTAKDTVQYLYTAILLKYKDPK